MNEKFQTVVSLINQLNQRYKLSYIAISEKIDRLVSEVTLRRYTKLGPSRNTDKTLDELHERLLRLFEEVAGVPYEQAQLTECDLLTFAPRKTQRFQSIRDIYLYQFSSLIPEFKEFSDEEQLKAITSLPDYLFKQQSFFIKRPRIYDKTKIDVVVRDVDGLIHAGVQHLCAYYRITEYELQQFYHIKPSKPIDKTKKVFNPLEAISSRYSMEDIYNLNRIFRLFGTITLSDFLPFDINTGHAKNTGGGVVC